MLTRPTAYAPLPSLLEDYLQGRLQSGMVSIVNAVRTIRHALPHCEHTDEELGTIVAVEAVRRGFAVAFDLRAQDATSSLEPQA